jgi:hypothetical protein
MLTVADLTEKEEEIYQERAAIMEYDGNMTRREAEMRALDEIERKRRLI